MLLISTAIYCQSNKVPPFRMMQSSGKVFKAEDLPIGNPIIIIYFSPECDHCEKLVKEVDSRQKSLQKASIVFLTYLSLESVSKFENQNHFLKNKNIYTGTEINTFYFKNYYNIDEIPFVALYTKEGDLIRKYTRPSSLDALCSQVKKLKSSNKLKQSKR